MAVEDLDQALQTHNTDLIWYSIQAILVSTGHISNLLWPPLAQSQKRGKELRASLGVKEDFALRPKYFRNHFEHFDERLEKWAKASERGIFFDSNVGPLSAIGGVDARDLLRNFDPSTFTLTFRGDEYGLKPIIDVISELWQRAEPEANRPY